MTGADAEFWHAWAPDAPFHTLKVLVVDPVYRGRALTLDEMVAVLPRHLGLIARATQKVVSGRGFDSLPFWVEDDEFDLTAHLDERLLASPGGRRELDALCAELAAEQLDRSRPLWASDHPHLRAPGRAASRLDLAFVAHAPSGRERVCASTTVDLVSLKALAHDRGATLNGAFHAVLGEALREELADRGEHVDRPLVALFNVAADRTSSRTHGNAISTVRSYLHVQHPDRADRVDETAPSCTLAVDLRRRAGFDLHEVSSELRGKALSSLRPRVARFTPRVLNHVTTVNVAGPDHTRWLGDLPVVEWASFAVAVAPADVNLTAHSYNGQIVLGLVTTPESMPDPAHFLQRVRRALDSLAAEQLTS